MNRKHFWQQNILGLLCLLASACNHQVAVKTVLVQKKVLSAPQIYSGTLKPLTILNVASPVEGTIASLNVQPGQTVKAQTLIMTINSLKFAQAYQQAVLTYLKTKSDHDNLLKKFQGTQELWAHGLIARNDFDAAQTELANSYALLLQQQTALKSYLPRGTALDPTLSLANTSLITKLFTHPHTLVPLYAPVDGVILTSQKTTNQNGDDTATFPTIGTLVKEGDSLLSIGDLSAYLITIQVSQMDIDRIQVGQAVTISGDAFNKVLAGKVSAVSIQAKTDQNSSLGGMPSFPVDIHVAPLQASANKGIRLGMSVKVALTTTSQPMLSIPLSAVGEHNGQSVVMRVQHQRTDIVPITTGATSLDEVEVLSGLTEGERIRATYPT